MGLSGRLSSRLGLHHERKVEKEAYAQEDACQIQVNIHHMISVNPMQDIQKAATGKVNATMADPSKHPPHDISEPNARHSEGCHWKSQRNYGWILLQVLLYCVSKVS